MRTLAEVIALFGALGPAEVEGWIARRWVIPERDPEGGYLFREVDVARIRLIRDIRHELRLDEEAVAVVLSLLDQVYGLRRGLAELCAAIGEQPPEVRRAIRVRLRRRAGRWRRAG